MADIQILNERSLNFHFKQMKNFSNDKNKSLSMKNGSLSKKFTILSIFHRIVEFCKPSY